MNVNVLSKAGKETGRTVELRDSVFGIEPNRTVMYEDVRRYLANQRQGTAKTKDRSEITGSTRKLFRQKGTGGARRGDIKSPILRGGGTIFGPRPRTYSVGLTRKMIRLARRSALSAKAAQNGIMVVERFDLDAPKTRVMVDFLSALSLDGRKVLLLTPGTMRNVYLSGRNIPGLQVLEADKPATYQIMKADVLVFMEEALEELQTLLTPAEKAMETVVEEASAPVAAAEASNDETLEEQA
jgi:large subunit ribosomal protein L4